MKLLALLLPAFICFNFVSLSNLIEDSSQLSDFDCSNKLECLQGHSLLLIVFATFIQNPTFNLMKMKERPQFKDMMKKSGTRGKDGRIRIMKKINNYRSRFVN